MHGVLKICDKKWNLYIFLKKYVSVDFLQWVMCTEQKKTCFTSLENTAHHNVTSKTHSRLKTHIRCKYTYKQWRNNTTIIWPKQTLSSLYALVSGKGRVFPHHKDRILLRYVINTTLQTDHVRDLTSPAIKLQRKL